LEKNLAASMELAESISQSGGDLNFLIDQLLDKLREELLKNADNKSLLQKLMLLTSQLIVSKREMKEFPNKKTVFEIAIIRICGGSDYTSAPTRVQEVAKNEEMKELKNEKIEPQVVADKKLEYVAERPAEGIDLKTHLVGRSGSISQRFKAVLNSSNIVIVGTSVKIINSSKFNIALLNKPDHVNFILNISKEISNGLDSVDFVIGETEDQPVNKTVAEVMQEIKKEEESKEVYNTELVANLL